MALKYTSYAIGYGAGIQVSGNLPLDIRTVVQNKSDLTNPATWAGNPVYHGLLVSVTSEKRVYMFIPAGGTGYDPTIESSWKKVGGSSSKIEVVTIKQYEASYNVPSTDPLNPGKTVALYGLHEIEFESEENDTAYVWYRADDPDNDENVVPDENANHETVLAEGTGIVVVNESVLSEGVYIKVTDIDEGIITYAKIDFDDLYDKIDNVSIRVNDISTAVDDLSTNVSRLGKAFIFRGGALYNSDTTVTPNTSNYLVKDEYDTPLDNLRGGDVYQTVEEEGDKEWVYVEDSSVAGHWVELGLALGGFVSSINVSTDDYINASAYERDANGAVKIDISLNVGSIDNATAANSSILATAYDVSTHLATVNASISELDEVIAHTITTMAETIGLNSSFGVDWNTSIGIQENISYKEAIEDIHEKFQWIIVN